MRYYIGILIILTVFAIPQAFAGCIVNEDWPDAPCLDSIGNGYYDQDEVNQWAKYYQYKGAEFMEQKRAEMNDAIKNDTLKEWVAESIQNENVYSYYFFSGRAPDIGIYTAQFDEFGVWQNPAIHEPFDNSDVVLVGTVVQVNITPENKTQYDFKVDEYLKGEKPFDLITATLDDVRPANFPKDPLDYFNRPYFEKNNQVFVYLRQDGSTFEMSPYSFTVKKPTVVGPPSVIHATGPHQHIIPQGEEIVISGNIKKAYLYSMEKSGFDSSFDLVILDENEELVDSKKLDINLDGSYSFSFQDKDELRIPGKYSWNIAYHNGGMGGEFIVKTDQKLWKPLKQFHAGIPYVEIQCRDGLQLTQKYDGLPACVKPETYHELIKRDWVSEIIKAVQSRDISEVKPEPEPEPKPIPEAEQLKRQMQLTALNEVQEILQTDYRGNEIKINAIKEYVDKFESDYFMKQFLFALKDQYKKGDMINFTFAEWGYQNKECTSPVLKMYLKPYDNYSAFGSIQKIYEWQNPNYCDSLEPYHGGYLILNFWRMPDFSEQYRSCTVPGEYKIFASSNNGENIESVGSFTCQREMLEGEPQPWMELPD